MSAENGNAAGKANGAARVQRPNREKFDKELAALQAELSDKSKALDKAKEAVEKAQPKGANSEREQLLKELETVKASRDKNKSGRDKVLEEIRQVEDGLKRKIKDLNNARSKVQFKSADEIDAQISKLEKLVDSGTLRLVDEKRHLSDISNLKKAKKGLGALSDMQSEIDADKAKVSALRAKLDDPESKAAADKYNEIRKKLDAVRDQQQAAYKSLNALRDKRGAAHAAYGETKKKIEQLKDEFYGQLRAYREQAKADQAARAEREKAERAAQEKARKREAAQAKLDDASEPAFAAQIDTAENLLVHFDPEYKRQGSAAKSTTAKQPTRKVEKPEGAKLLVKEDDVLFEGSGPKRGKKKGGKSGSADKLRLNAGVIDDLASLNIGIPASVNDVANTIQKLKEKLQYYHENQERVTQERVERAKAEIAKIEADEAKADAESTEPAAESTTETKDAPAEVEASA